ncbi:DUF4401 domain-containing protein [Paraflavitalea pollutisoli]|uniref:DUF4401 domain-containing protein n=1 Tax=Paraflavitalea pollutisoli TaxID=3034143 RepID=UPI0023EBCAF6|nr:DUF4401 domain-containing protein [Paraflavitalea sp. H1-2-19X]
MKRTNEIPALLHRLQSLTGTDLSDSEATLVQAYQAKEKNRGSLIIRILMIAGGFLAMVFLLACLAVFGLFDSEGSIIVLGILFTIAGLVIVQAKHLLVDTIAATAFMAGLILIGTGVAINNVSLTQVCLLMTITGLVCLVITNNSVLAFIAALTATGCVYFIFPASTNFVALFVTRAVLAWLFTLLITHEARVITLHPKMAMLYRPVCLAMTCSLLVGYFAGWFQEFHHLHKYIHYIEPVAIIAAILYAIVPVLKRFGMTSRQATWKALTAAALLLIPTVFVPGVPVALLVLLLSFGWRYAAGIVLGIAALIYYICQYYYDLQLSLLMKAWLLLLPGALLIGLYFALHQHFQRDEKI